MSPTILVVAQNTIKEIVRDRILYGLILFAIFLVVLSLFLGNLSYAEQERIITDLGLVAVELGCCMLAIFVGSSLVWREIEKQTVLLLLSKPVKRSQFLFGKFLGLALVLIFVDLLVSVFLALTCKLYGTVFWQQFFISQLGILLESLLLLSFSIFFGVFCKPAMTILFSLSIWLVGHGVNDLHYFSEKSESPILKYIGLFITRIIPNLEYFSFRESVIYGDVIPLASVFRAVAVWASWTVILIISSTWIFKKRDFI